ncbi:hypothetical protein WN55_10902 [Dufourea novaeangliae]|uniref:Uncharacterized protein n=1 Tax=Dufourea novaeangliae TaxID=178035 RepID=A0A154P9E2_DUFNO|nr:hypothetical protein WN55_10902 [Dufourea novaeangliae]
MLIRMPQGNAERIKLPDLREQQSTRQARTLPDNNTLEFWKLQASSSKGYFLNVLTEGSH